MQKKINKNKDIEENSQKFREFLKNNKEKIDKVVEKDIEISKDDPWRDEDWEK